MRACLCRRRFRANLARRVQDTDWTHVMLKPSTGLHGISLRSQRCGIEYFGMVMHWPESGGECNRLIRNPLNWATIVASSVPSIVARLSHQQRPGMTFDMSNWTIEATAGVMGSNPIGGPLVVGSCQQPAMMGVLAAKWTVFRRMDCIECNGHRFEIDRGSRAEKPGFTGFFVVAGTVSASSFRV